MPFPVGVGGYNIQLILKLHGFHICKFTYLLKFIRNPTINTAILWLFVDMQGMAENLRST